MNKALFLDRDGVINIDHGHVYKIEEFAFIEGIFELTKRYQNLGYKIIIITNQAGIAKGYYQREDFLTLMDWMINEFTQKGIHIDDYYFEESLEENHYRRKPNPGMFLEAINKHQIDPTESIMIGDKMSDLIAAHKANVKHLYFLKGRYEEKRVDFNYQTIYHLNEIK
jgi:D-glycero-D-manno-heptose 1,7-bisphosphate phosphatase